MELPPFQLLSFIAGIIVCLVFSGVIFFGLKVIKGKKKPKLETLMTTIDDTRMSISKVSDNITKLYELLMEIQDA